MHYPEGQISDLQRRQLTTAVDDSSGGGVRVVAFEGGGDDMDAPIKAVMTEHNQSGSSSSNHKNSKSRRTGVNSYNIGRPLAQMVHFLWTYLRIAEREQWNLSSAPPRTTNYRRWT